LGRAVAATVSAGRFFPGLSGREGKSFGHHLETFSKWPEYSG